MNFFQRIISSIVKFFKSPSGKKITAHALEILQEVAGTYGPQLYARAYTAVKKAEREGGADKYERVFKELRSIFTDDKLGEQALNTAIELALAALRKEIDARGISVLNQ